MRLIKNYKINNRLKFTVELAYDNNGNSIIRGIRHVPHGTYKHHATLKGLFRLLDGRVYLFPLIETREGVIPLPLCVEAKLGGYLRF